MEEVSHIVKWQQGVSPDRNTDEPLVAHLYKACSELYMAALKELAGDTSIDEAILLGLQRSHSYLVLWADGYSVSDGSLDASLDNSWRAKRSTLRLLISICQTITKRLLKILSRDQQDLLCDKAAAVIHTAEKLKYVAQKDDAADSNSDTSSDASSVTGASELEEIAEDLKTDTECLLELGSRFNEKTVGPVITESAVDPTLLEAWDPSKNFIDRIRWRYPQCQPKLAERLGEANWARVLRYQEKKNTSNPLQPTEPQIRADTKAATIKGSTGASTTFHDSALGSSVPSGPSLPAAPSLYAETLASYYGGQGESVRVPSLPEGATKAVPFLCVGCGEYSTPFPTKNEWEIHMATEHDLGGPDGFSCPMCQETLSDAIKVRTHMARHLEEVALTVLPTNPDSEDGTDDDSGLASSETSSQQYNFMSEVASNPMTVPAVSWNLGDGPSTHMPFPDVVDRIQAKLFRPLLERADLEAFHESIFNTREEMLTLDFLGGFVLRDAEMDLILNAQKSAPTPEHFQEFSLLVLATIQEIIPEFAGSNLTRPDEQPYDEEYFVEAEKRVRRTARQIKDALEAHNPEAPSAADKGKSIGPDAQEVYDEAVERALRFITRRKPDSHFTEYRTCKEPGCNKQFKRPCDLTKHEKTHSRPFKCPMPTCKYHEYGWPTEKEMSRHFADKHGQDVNKFKCLFEPCPYVSKRESNCKQHMEKAHGWTYVRTKHNTKKLDPVRMPRSETESPGVSEQPQLPGPGFGKEQPAEFGLHGDKFHFQTP
ncbi:hypothetical protein S7711_09297 [Stachybotrys chartarum IBT 7711]|uniref:C2H2-type domain-containing protein n=1 Tax=Stachybotrys chartarum (strain CBS 109288 / IBT 7711) TaxID=1280523 RepID=A0A084AJM8_STACB|nr:hypothetical protein S7711_09297 [Stachybotrys chartarum IBT 7711]KFA45866.1 hypothetical protein S40293_09344 [Stachybotrys chartarum IBT 40293]